MDHYDKEFGMFLGKLIETAIDISEKSGRYFIGVEDLFCILAHDKKSLTNRLLKQIGLNTDTACREISRLSYFPGEIDEKRLWKGIPLTPRLQQVIVLSEKAAGDKHSIDEKLFLLSITQEGHSIPLRWLQRQNISLEALGDIVEKSVVEKFEAPAEEIDPEDRSDISPESYLDVTTAQKENDDDTVELEFSFLNHHTCNRSTGVNRDYWAPPVRPGETEKLMSIYIKPGRKSPLILSKEEKINCSVFESLANYVINGDVPDSLKNCIIFEMDPEVIIDDLEDSKNPQKVIEGIINEASQAGNIIYINNIHRLTRGVGKDRHGFLKTLRSAIIRGKVQCIGASTIDRYYNCIKNDESLTPIFEPIIIQEKTPSETYSDLLKIRESLERHFRVRIEDKILKYAINLAYKYISGFCLPENTLELLTLACTGIESPYTKEGFSYESLGIKLYANENHLTKALTNLTDFPFHRMMEKGDFYFTEMKKKMNEKIFGREDAINEIINILIRSLYKDISNDKSRPIAVYLFLGPPAVGKTLMAEELTRYIYGTPHKLIRVDLSRYTEKDDINRLINLSPETECKDEGELIERLRLKPYSVVLLENLEMAHPELLRVLSDAINTGRISLHRRKDLDCKGAIFITTSTHKEIENEVYPEFLRGIDKILRFTDLDDEALVGIVQDSLKKITEKYKEDDITIEFRKKVERWVLKKASEELERTRAIEKIIQNSISDKLSEGMLKGEYVPGDTLGVNILGGNLLIVKQHGI